MITVLETSLQPAHKLWVTCVSNAAINFSSTYPQHVTSFYGSQIQTNFAILFGDYYVESVRDKFE